MGEIFSFGEWVRRRRRALDLTQDALARRVGCALSMVRKIESDERRPSRQIAELLADALAVPPAERDQFLRTARAELAPDRLTPPAVATQDVALLRRPARPRESMLLPLVGRHAEWHVLQAGWQSARQGRAQLVVIIGEAGIGKTRLAEELLTYADQDGARTAHAHTYAAAGQLAYAPLVAWLRTPVLSQRIGLLGGADLAELARLMPELLHERPELAPPAPATESWQRLRMFEALARAILADRQPLLLVLNDLQWCDQETLDWLHFLLRHDPTAPLLVLATVRAEDARADALRAWWQTLEREEQVTRLALSALDAPATQALAEQLVAGALSAEQAAQLYQQTEGNPLFVVELVRAELSAGWSAPGAEQPSLRPFTALPARMQAVLQTRLAQLSPAAHELISLAAVVGRAFTTAVLAHASGERERNVVAALDELWQRRIVREQADGSYDFSHDKLREVARAALSPARRRMLHRQVAEALEQIHAQRLDEVSGEIAAHYDQAGLPEQAIPSYHHSATVAHRVGALQEASEQLERGLALIRGLPSTPQRLQQELELQVDLALVLMLLRGFAASVTEQAYVRALALARQAEGHPQLYSILWGLHEVYMFQAKGEQARAMAEQCMVLAQDQQDTALLLQAHHAIGPVLLQFFPDETTQALRHLETVIALYDPQQHQRYIQYGGHDPSVCAHMISAKILWRLGYPQQSFQRCQLTLQLAQDLDHSYSLALAIINMASLHAYRREPEIVTALASRAIQICHQHQFHMILAESQILHGWAQAMQRDVEAGLLELHGGIAAWVAADTIAEQMFHQLLLTEVYLATNQSSTALRVVNHAIALTSNEVYLETEAHRLHGVALLATGAPANQAEESFQRALEISRRQGTRSLELRASVSMARLWQSQGRRTDAHALLSAIYGWFTEGFDTIDLIEARALLDELATTEASASV